MKNAMTYKGYTARIEFDAEDRIFFEIFKNINCSFSSSNFYFYAHRRE